MAFIIKALGSNNITTVGTTPLYTVADPKSAIVSSVRITNISTLNAATVNLQVKASGGATTARQIAKPNFVINVGAMLLMEDLVTLGKGDRIQVVVSATSPNLDWMVIGLERD